MIAVIAVIADNCEGHPAHARLWRSLWPRRRGARSLAVPCEIADRFGRAK